MSGEITTAHLALGLTILGMVTSAGTALGLFALQRLFGGGDKAGAEIDELKEKVHALELAQVGQYATKQDVESLRRDIRGEFDRLAKMLAPVFSQFHANPVYKG